VAEGATSIIRDLYRLELGWDIYGAICFELGIAKLVHTLATSGSRLSVDKAITRLKLFLLNIIAASSKVVVDASRHIVSTTVTTFGGFLPLILEGSEFWPPFAMAIAGGVLLSTIVSFYLVPPLYTLLMHPRRHFLQHRSEEAVPKPSVALREVA